jgi:hypothetical protein
VHVSPRPGWHLVCWPCARPWCRSGPEMPRAHPPAAVWLTPRSGVQERVPPAGRYVRHRTLQTQFRPARPTDTPPFIEAYADRPVMERVMQTVQHLPATTASSNRSYGVLTPAAQAHRRRCKSLPPVQAGEAERLMADFLATRGVTACPTRYAAPIEQRPQLARSGY